MWTPNNREQVFGIRQYGGALPATLGLAARRGHVAPKSIPARKPGALL
jgi:hypothetical protein